MRIGTAEDYIEIQQSQLTIKTFSMSGSTFIDWDATNFDQFIKDLKQLEKTRQGKAALKHLSYQSEFRSFYLEIFSIDRLGHMAIKVEINRIHYLQSTQPVANTLSVVLEIDVEKFSTIVSEFINLVK